MVGRRGKARRIGILPEYVGFFPEGIPTGEAVVLTLDELETIRLLDLEKLSQEEAAARMGVARTTVTSIYERARTKVADSLINGKELSVEGGNVVFTPVAEHRAHVVANPKKAGVMRVAVTFENGQIFQHFGKTQEFKLYDVEGGAVASSQVVGTQGAGHGALAMFLKDNGVDAVICGGIGGGAQNALANAGIKLYGGAAGSCDEAVAALLAGTLQNAADPSHHGHGHGEGECHHGEHGHGEHGHGHEHGHGDDECCHGAHHEEGECCGAHSEHHGAHGAHHGEGHAHAHN